MNESAHKSSVDIQNKASYKFTKTLLGGKHKFRFLCLLFLSVFLTCVYFFNYHFHYGFPYTNALVVFIFLSFLYSVKTSLDVAEESLLVISHLGLQTTTLYCVGTFHSKFIPWSSVKDVILNEAVSGFRMVHYLAALVKHESGNTYLVPLLLNAKLRLHEIREIYIKIQKILKN